MESANWGGGGGGRGGGGLRNPLLYFTPVYTSLSFSRRTCSVSGGEPKTLHLYIATKRKSKKEHPVTPARALALSSWADQIPRRHGGGDAEALPRAAKPHPGGERPVVVRGHLEGGVRSPVIGDPGQAADQRDQLLAYAAGARRRVAGLFLWFPCVYHWLVVISDVYFAVVGAACGR